MEDSIDLRPYILALLRYWWAIVALAALGAVLGIVYYLSRTEYHATAWLAISEPSQSLQFDERIESTDELDLMLEAYPQLAFTDEVLTGMLPAIAERTDGQINDLVTLRTHLYADRGNAPRLLRMTARADDPELAAFIANLWADHMSEAIDTLYRNPGGQIEFYQAQITDGAAQLQTTEQALVEFQRQNRQGIVKNELDALSLLQGSYLAERNALQLLQDDVQALRDQLLADQVSPLTFADQLTALSLQLQAFGSHNMAMDTSDPLQPIQLQPSQVQPFQLQINGPEGNLTTSDRNTQIQLLDSLARTVESRLAATDIELPQIETRLLSLQGEYQALVNDFDRLTRDREVAQETYLTLVRKLDEVRISSEDAGNRVQIVSRALPPALPQRPGWLQLVVLGAFAGALLSSAIIVLITWRRQQVALSS